MLGQVALSGCIVPPLWRLEVANALQIAIRRKRVDAAFRDHALQQLIALPIRIDTECDDHVWTTTLQLADHFSLTIYDATYLELAHRLELPLASLDKELRAAGRASSLRLLGT